MNQKIALILIAIILTGCNPFAITQRTTVPADIPPAGPTPIEVLEECPVTSPPQPAFVPQTGAVPWEGLFFYGSDSLWTSLPSSGVWEALPQSEKGFNQKIFWWSRDFDMSSEAGPSLKVTALLLDDKNPAPLMVLSSPATTGNQVDAGSFMLAGLDFPTEGCWQITGEYKNETLSFNVLVKR